MGMSRSNHAGVHDMHTRGRPKEVRTHACKALSAAARIHCLHTTGRSAAHDRNGRNGSSTWALVLGPRQLNQEGVCGQNCAWWKQMGMASGVKQSNDMPRGLAL